MKKGLVRDKTYALSPPQKPNKRQTQYSTHKGQKSKATKPSDFGALSYCRGPKFPLYTLYFVVKDNCKKKKHHQTSQ